MRVDCGPSVGRQWTVTKRWRVDRERLVGSSGAMAAHRVIRNAVIFLKAALRFTTSHTERMTPSFPSSPSAAGIPQPFFRPGDNCWRVEHANRFRMLVDGEEYFTALRAAILNAQQTIFILGWDIDSRMKLVPGDANDGFPEPLAEFLHGVVAARKHLRIYVLSWDFAMLYAFEREWLPVFKMGWRAHRRFAFHQDGRHPIGGSHHQKIVLIDDRLAFVGGLDLTRSRWDTRAHSARQPLRRDPNGDPYPPFHDIQVMFDGDAATALGELVRERWVRANGRRVAMLSAKMRAARHDPWPAAVVPDIEDVDLAICRTEPEYAGRAGVQEIRQMYLDGIRRADRAIFCENQYFTSGIIGKALLERLEETDGPDIAIVSRRVEGGWLQEATMGVLRARLHKSMKATGGADRYSLYCPHIPGLGEDCVNVHSKVMVVDDDLLFVGSANLNNRSMVLDTECNVALDGAGDMRVSRAIAGMRNRLLAEHLDQTEEVVAQTLLRTGSLIATIETLRHNARTLMPHEPSVTPDLDRLVPSEAVIDPETPIAPDRLVAQFVPQPARRPLLGRFALLGVLALLIAAAAGLWRWTPLGQVMNVTALTHVTERLAALPFSPVIIIAAYTLAGVLLVPVTLLIAVSGLAFGGVQGCLYALSGTMASAAISYLIGRSLGRDKVREWAGQRINGLSERLAQRGIVSVVVLRILPVAPFAVINLIAGASQIGFRDFLLGTLLGMGPGIIITVAFAHHLVQAIQHPTWTSFSVLVAIGALMVGVSILLQRFFRSREQVGKRGGKRGEQRDGERSHEQHHTQAEVHAHSQTVTRRR